MMATNQKEKNLKTCLCCGKRARKETWLLCVEGEKLYSKMAGESADALLTGKMEEIVPINDKFQFLIDLAEGRIINPNYPERVAGTLQFLQERAEEAEANLQLEEDSLWEKACGYVMKKVGNQKVGQEVIDRATKSLWETKKKESKDYNEMSRKAFGYRRSFETSGYFLREVKQKRIEFLQEEMATSLEGAKNVA